MKSTLRALLPICWYDVHRTLYLYYVHRTRYDVRVRRTSYIVHRHLHLYEYVVVHTRYTDVHRTRYIVQGTMCRWYKVQSIICIRKVAVGCARASERREPTQRTRERAAHERVEQAAASSPTMYDVRCTSYLVHRT